MPNRHIDDGTKIQALALLYSGLHHRPPNIPIHDVVAYSSQVTGISASQLYRLRDKAESRGFNYSEDPKLKLAHVQDEERLGRPKKVTEDVTAKIVNIISRNRASRELNLEEIAYRVGGISAESVRRVLKKGGYRKVKTTKKPGLSQEQKDQRLAFAIAHADWTLENWKNVIWSDETSVVLGHRRGAVRVWRLTSERYDKSVIRRRWKGFTEFMFWGCFSYDHKGPCHIWTPETAAEKKTAKADLEERNWEAEPAARADWELRTRMRRLDLKKKPGKKPEWRFTKKTGKLVRQGKGGIDWYRYQRVILKEKLLPFAAECLKNKPGTIVQEDNAPSHAHRDQQRVYDLWRVLKLTWCGNSPDINAIEPAWPWMKRTTTKRGAPRTMKLASKVWMKAWEDLPQCMIQKWIERIPLHIQRIIELKGGNEYPEGKEFLEARKDRAAAAKARRQLYKDIRLRGEPADASWDDVDDEVEPQSDADYPVSSSSDSEGDDDRASQIPAGRGGSAARGKTARGRATSQGSRGGRGGGRLGRQRG